MYLFYLIPEHESYNMEVDLMQREIIYIYQSKLLQSFFKTKHMVKSLTKVKGKPDSPSQILINSNNARFD